MNFGKINFINALFQNHPKTILCFALCIMTISAYWPVKNYPFIHFDDGPYVYENTKVRSGLTIPNIIWAFSLSGAAADKDQNYWHPLALISHMVDVELFGVDPHLHHMSNLFFHSINAILLFLVFSLMTGDTWKCFFVAALFALHPMNIESVAWIAERKNLLSTTFWMITMLAYMYYAKRPSISRYVLVFLAFSFGLLAKPMLVVLPCVLMLMDYWPLKRTKWAHWLNNNNNFAIRMPPKTTFSDASSIQLIFEKIPLLLISFATIHISMITLQGKSQVINNAMLPLSLRIENAFVSYLVYLYKMILPVNLAIFYPFPDTIPAWQTIGAIIFLSIATGFALIRSKTKPYLIIGWLWFLGVLFPVIGLVQGGLWPAQADRWAYVPLIGIFIVIAWGLTNLLSKWRYRKAVLSLSATCVIILLFWTTRTQLAYWTDTYTLFNRAIAVTDNNYFAYNVLGDELALKGDYEAAEKYFLTALKIKSNDFDAMERLGQLSFRNKKYDQAIHYYSKALSINPSDPKIYNNLGLVFFSKDMLEQAREKFEAAIRLNPKFDEAYYHLGLVFSKQGKATEAIINYQKAIAFKPDDAEAHKSLADALFFKGDMAQALDHYSKALETNPNDAATHYNIGVILFQQQQIKEADEHFYKAVQIDNTYEKAKTARSMTRNILERGKR
jgi:tetratricopeptide (TPR) repeat protein